MLLHIIDSTRLMEVHNALMVTSCLATILVFSIGLAFFRFELMYNTKPFLISGARRDPCSLTSF